MATAAGRRRPVVTREECERRYDLNVRRLLVAVLQRAARDAQGNIERHLGSTSKDEVMEEARRWLWSDDCADLALSLGFSVRTFRTYLANIPKPKESPDEV